MSHVLTVNAGSSTIKFAVFEDDTCLVSGNAERIGSAHACLTIAAGEGAAERAALPPEGLHDHAGAMAAILSELGARLGHVRIDAVGHRIVHGGLFYDRPTGITPEVIARLESLSPFAPLHQPHNLAGARAAMAAFPDALQMACFDTAFHRNHPFVNDTFALPRAYYDKGVRRYGFHGLSYEYISGELARVAPLLHAGRVVVAHLGNGASMCGLLNGRSIASTMGFSALDGLPMGTRSGQIDPGVLLYLLQQEGMSGDEIADLLYRRSGLLGMSGLTNDMRELEASDSQSARDAIEYFVFRIRRELGGLAAALGGLDALVFCGGIGENSRLVRRRVCVNLDWIGIELDEGRNAENAFEINTRHSRVRVLVIPTQEDLVIARAANAMLSRRDAG